MLLVILAVLLVLGIMFWQVLQGVFTALINMILTILSALIAFNYAEGLGLSLAGTDGNPILMQALCMGGLFIVILLVLRILFDMIISNDVKFDTWPNRIAGGAFGLVTGIVVTGMLAIVLQMLPWGDTVVTYRPYDDQLQRRSALYLFWPDQAVVGTVNFLSKNSMAGDQTFESVHDDYLRELFADRSRQGFTIEDKPVGLEPKARNDCSPGDMTLGYFYKIPDPLPLYLQDTTLVPENPGKVQMATALYVVRTRISENARDEDDWWRLPATQFRLVTNKHHSFYPVAFLTYGTKVQNDKSTGWQAITAYDREKAQPKLTQIMAERKWTTEHKEVSVDWIFRVPDSEVPVKVAFRRAAVAQLGKPVDGLPQPAGALVRGAQSPEGKSAPVNPGPTPVTPTPPGPTNLTPQPNPGPTTPTPANPTNPRTGFGGPLAPPTTTPPESAEGGAAEGEPEIDGGMAVLVIVLIGISLIAGAVGFAGWIWIVVIAFKDSVGWGLLALLLCGLGGLIYAARNKEECKVPGMMLGAAVTVNILIRVISHVAFK